MSDRQNINPAQAADGASKLVEASLHSAELLRAQGDALVAIAQSYQAEANALADDIEERAQRFHQRMQDFCATIDDARNAFRRESERLEKYFPAERPVALLISDAPMRQVEPPPEQE